MSFVVDDTSEFRAIVRFIMATESQAMTLVGEAADGEEALPFILDARPDIVITDLLMPRMNGIELLRRIKAARPETKVIVMTSLRRGHLPAAGPHGWRGRVPQ